MAKTLALLHTTSVTVALFKELAEKHLPGIRVIQLLDDSLLPEVMAAGEVTSGVRGRMAVYIGQAKAAGADAVMSCCSSVGQAMEELGSAAGIPVWRVDEAMASEAVAHGSKITVLATARTTLAPTAQLIERKAREAGRDVDVRPLWIEGALEALSSGRTDEHDKRVTSALNDASRASDVIVLAQASMARLISAVPPSPTLKILTSPVSGLKLARERLEK